MVWFKVGVIYRIGVEVRFKIRVEVRVKVRIKFRVKITVEVNNSKFMTLVLLINRKF